MHQIKRTSQQTPLITSQELSRVLVEQQIYPAIQASQAPQIAHYLATHPQIRAAWLDDLEFQQRLERE